MAFGLRYLFSSETMQKLKKAELSQKRSYKTFGTLDSALKSIAKHFDEIVDELHRNGMHVIFRYPDEDYQYVDNFAQWFKEVSDDFDVFRDESMYEFTIYSGYVLVGYLNISLKSEKPNVVVENRSVLDELNKKKQFKVIMNGTEYVYKTLDDAKRALRKSLIEMTPYFKFSDGDILQIPTNLILLYVQKNEKILKQTTWLVYDENVGTYVPLTFEIRPLDIKPDETFANDQKRMMKRMFESQKVENINESPMKKQGLTRQRQQ